MEDDIYPNNGSYFLPREPKDQIIARQKEKAKTLEALPIIENVIKHFNDRIEFRNKIDSINVQVNDDPALHQKMMHVNELLKQELEVEKALLEELLRLHAKK